MAGIPGSGGVKGRSGPPGNQNAFRHGLGAHRSATHIENLQQEREQHPQQILQGLIQDRGGEEQISAAMRVLAELIAADTAWLMSFNRSMDNVLKTNAKVRSKPRGLHQLDNYKRGLVNSLSANLK